MLVVILIALFGSGTVAAQEAAEGDPRDGGPYLALGYGFGSLSYGAPPPADHLERDPGPTVLVPRLGYRLSPRTSVGVDLGLWAGRSTLNVDTDYLNARVFIETAPRWGRGLRLGAAAGVGWMRLDLRTQGWYRDRGPLLAVEAAYDWTVASMVAITPYLSVSRGWLGEDNASLIHGGLRLTLW